MSGERARGRSRTLNRRRFVQSVAVAGLVPGVVRAAEDIVELSWADLVPKGAGTDLGRLQALGIVPHDEMSEMQSDQPASSGVRTEYNGRIVRLPGYVVPLDTTGVGVTAFILVPFVGACVHVPPPPANQLVFVTTATPYESSGLFEAVNVTGMFGAASTSTQLADIGYALSADLIEPFR